MLLLATGWLLCWTAATVVVDDDDDDVTMLAQSRYAGGRQARA